MCGDSELPFISIGLRVLANLLSHRIRHIVVGLGEVRGRHASGIVMAKETNKAETDLRELHLHKIQHSLGHFCQL